MARLEHVNVTVADPDKTAAVFCELFGWHVRWAGAAKNGGRTVHVGEAESYLALYGPKLAPKVADVSYDQLNGLNHIGVVVADLEATEARVKAAGYVPENHADYEPGRRFYFHDHNGVEIEVVSYEKA
jgi:catechol 2,3-dioxygenase-like lactoylglutathione lyase family enzyme